MGKWCWGTCGGLGGGGCGCFAGKDYSLGVQFGLGGRDGFECEGLRGEKVGADVPDFEVDVFAGDENAKLGLKLCGDDFAGKFNGVSVDVGPGAGTGGGV